MLKKIMLAAVCLIGLAGISTANENSDLPMNVFFQLDSAVLTAQGRATIDELFAKIPDPECARIEIVGYACELGEEDYNLILSQKRVDAVYNALVLKGFHPDRVSQKYLGESDQTQIFKKLFKQGETGNRSAYLKYNRDVEIYVLPRKSWYDNHKCQQYLNDDSYWSRVEY
ncbi:MAG: OmpA family protein [Rickettsiales bacterium]|jgi:outer membrane protein OmpA-like peptidoglycan-associated protein|nr:OmpA family protein [Rickettsiales bacterium]